MIDNPTKITCALISDVFRRYMQVTPECAEGILFVG